MMAGAGSCPAVSDDQSGDLISEQESGWLGRRGRPRRWPSTPSVSTRSGAARLGAVEPVRVLRAGERAPALPVARGGPDTSDGWGGCAAHQPALRPRRARPSSRCSIATATTSRAASSRWLRGTRRRCWCAGRRGLARRHGCPPTAAPRSRGLLTGDARAHDRVGDVRGRQVQVRGAGVRWGVHLRVSGMGVSTTAPATRFSVGSEPSGAISPTTHCDPRTWTRACATSSPVRQRAGGRVCGETRSAISINRVDFVGAPIAYVPDRLVNGRMVLVGDAAHVPTPMTGRGFGSSRRRRCARP